MWISTALHLTDHPVMKPQRLWSHEDLLLNQKLLSEAPSQWEMVEILVGGNAWGTNIACILLTLPRKAATCLVTPHKQVWNVLCPE